MNKTDEALYGAIKEVTALRQRTRGKTTPQVGGSESEVIRATALAWFNKHRVSLTNVFSEDELRPIDALYQTIVDSSHRYASRKKYVDVLMTIREHLIGLRSGNIVRLSTAPAKGVDTPPDFSKLIQDKSMQAILSRRWVEVAACIEANAPLAAVVMMGGLLEGLLLARVNQLTTQAPVFTAVAAPRDKQGKTLPLKEWTLHNYIAVAHELKWITATAKDIGEVLRDYRNYIHPQKELTHNVNLTPADSTLLWGIAKSIATQLVK